VSLLGHPGVPRRLGSWRVLLILLAVCSLSVSLWTRYALDNPDLEGPSQLKCRSLDAKRQHLLSDGLHWTAPAAKVTYFVAPRPSTRVVVTVPPVKDLFLEQWLFDRPPPSC
jgi:hypothetical protein